MKFCPITLDSISDWETYSHRGLRLLHPTLKDLKPIELSASDLREQAMLRATKISIQGMQPKLSAQLVPSQNCFSLVDTSGTYILKPPSDTWPELPANEALSMTLAQTIGLEVPVHGLVYNHLNELIYFIKRFDRFGRKGKYAVEDFSQLSLLTRETKYQSSMEKVTKVVNTYCSFPIPEKIKLFTLTLFSYLIGNEDMHLKNFSLIRKDDIIQLSPVYDLLNTTIALKNCEEELALPLNGKKNKIKRDDLLIYFGQTVLGLNAKVIDTTLEKFITALPTWHIFLERSFLSALMKEKYRNLIQQRFDCLMGS